MKLKIEMNLDNDAFGDDAFSRAQEIADQLTHLSKEIVEYGARVSTDWPIIDVNGNKVGRLTIY